MARADFHTHSLHSDGILSPSDLVARAASNGVKILALTDHDTTAGVEEARIAGEALGLRIVPGVELSAEIPNGGDAHILGYFSSTKQEGLQNELAMLREQRQHRGLAMLEKLAELKMPIAWEKVRQIAGEAAVGRPHIAHAMVEKGYVANVREAFDLYLHSGGPADAARIKLPPERAVSLIRESSGVAVLAHPSFLPDVEAALRHLVPAGLQGIEVYYKNYTEDQRAVFRKLGEANGLLPLGGSDYHGIHDDEREPGDIPLPDRVVEEFLALAESVWAVGPDNGLA